ncbi:MAG: DUF58 domain-containing protein [Gammaproteobacteria bacterium]|nr:DUF58 domain-containing protein [Gammaproteobacteria bacterium]MCB1880421.1 DUF58 domain-containing protein [Gammaproteobacteria bacterium]MCB1902593.1 DUF58 domain-containing protein [Gammaproteobacteria bacterium]
MNFRLLNPLRRLARSDNTGRASITPRRIYILPTGNGVLFAILLLLMLLGSINYANNLGFLLTFLLMGLGLVAMLHTWRNLVGLELKCGRAAPVFVGDAARFDIQLTNRRRWSRPGIQLQLRSGAPLTIDLAAAATGNLTLTSKTSRRGKLALPRFTLSTRYPLGLFNAWAYVELNAYCLVYPTPGARMPESPLPQYSRSQMGDRGVGADDFTGLRHYRPGDSPRHINWKALAREQGLQTKLFGGDRAEKCWLDWHHLQGDTEQRLSQLCRGVLDASGGDIEFGLRLPDIEFKPARDQQHRLNCLSALALFAEPK